MWVSTPHEGCVRNGDKIGRTCGCTRDRPSTALLSLYYLCSVVIRCDFVRFHVETFQRARASTLERPTSPTNHGPVPTPRGADARTVEWRARRARSSTGTCAQMWQNDHLCALRSLARRRSCGRRCAQREPRNNLLSSSSAAPVCGSAPIIFWAAKGGARTARGGGLRDSARGAARTIISAPF